MKSSWQERQEVALNHAERQTRLAAVRALAEKVPRPALKQPLRVNMHCHTTFSYNGYDASPAAVAWQAVRDGWYAAGICDFDVLDGMQEFLTATDLLMLRGTVNLETRVFFAEYADKEINSPGEPGVYYFMGGGFARPPMPGTSASRQLQQMREGVEERNRMLVARVNAFLSPLEIDYDTDVLPLTPAGNATERHICTAYYQKGRAQFSQLNDWQTFWGKTLGIDPATAAKIAADPMAFNDLSRAKLMKSGGPGYVVPTPETFPALEDVIAMIRDCGAVPMGAWLDGTRDGEEDIESMLLCLQAKGVAAFNIIPDRNWNIDDPDMRRIKVRNLHQCVAVADRLEMPLNVGTELNKFGQPWVDDFDVAAMKPVAASFIRGAEIMVGHQRLLRWADFSYISQAAEAEFPELSARNAFFQSVGALPSPPPSVQQELDNADTDTAYARIHDAVRHQGWG